MPIFGQDQLAAAVANTMPTQADLNQVGQSSGPSSLAGPIAALIGGNAADAGTTYAALRSNPNAYEANPLLPSNGGAIAGIKAAMTLPEILMLKYLNSHGHPTVAKVLGYGMGALGGGLAINNARQMNLK